MSIVKVNADGSYDTLGGLVSNDKWIGTDTEWNALSDAEKAKWNGKEVVFTNDYNSNVKQSVADCIASTSSDDVVGASAIKDLTNIVAEETLIGTYMGKPLYRQIIHGANFKTGNYTGGDPVAVSYPFDQSDKNIINYYGYFIRTDGFTQLFNVWNDQFTAYSKITFVKTANTMKLIHNQSNWSNALAYVTVEYTKN